ncbi:MAG TPA: MarR family winged helix-turn-helix transcriptional regulator [Candidatus Saccharimonadales bacterium]
MNNDLNTNIYWLLIQVATRARHELARIAEKQFNLTGVQFQTLCLLDAERPVPMNTISHQLVCDASNVTGIVDRLVAGGYIERREDPSDRRIKTIALTEKGLQTRRQIKKHLEAIEPEGIRELSTHDRKTLYRLLSHSLAAGGTDACKLP